MASTALRKNAPKAPPTREHRPSWSGNLKFGLVSIPVRAFAAKSDKAAISLHWLHAECHNRIRYLKTCPVHGEVPQDEIVSGYKVGANEYIEIDPDELKKLRPRKADTVDVTSMVPPEKIDDTYFTDDIYYLLPNGRSAVRPYAVFQEALAQKHFYGVGETVMFRREHLVVIRAIDRLMTLTVLTYPDRVKAVEPFERELPKEKTLARERDMAEMLIAQLADEHFDIKSFKDHYADDLQKLIDAKLKGKHIEVPSEEKPERAPLNFMDALRKSLKSGEPTKPARRRSGHGRARKAS